ncbi:hypothetical protein LXL04_023499 [Taraxacum kok-saghyz]
MAEDGRAKVDKFEGHDFAFWKMQIEDLLYQTAYEILVISVHLHKFSSYLINWLTMVVVVDGWMLMNAYHKSADECLL